ncbi:copper chaperone PCu(A)C [Chitinimonas sp.]|uniref:copper chaperone PCu(A)C n=1 Tax=Chitinimonas sp. TaxID=1934313 RepID=UPI0035AEF273
MKSLLIAAAVLLAPAALCADVTVSNAWIRATVPGQPVSGAYFDITAKKATRLVKVETPAAGLVQLHEMRTESGVMKMRQIDSISLPAGQTVSLAPSKMHVMLMNIPEPLTEGSKQTMILTFVEDGVRSQLKLSVPVKKGS